MIKRLIKKVIKFFLIIISNRHQKKYILKIIKRNKISKCNLKKEYLFKKKWQKLTSDVDSIYFHCFSKYIISNKLDTSNIYSGNISVNFIEPILNPIRFRPIYEDKNMYGKMYPKKYLPTTYLRKINGIYMDEDYHLIENMSNELLNSLLENLNQFIIKPSIDTNSGKGVCLYIRKDDIFLNQKDEILSLRKLDEKYKSNFIIQERLNQSPYLSQFNKSSLNTIRVLVYRSVNDNKIYITNAVFKIGYRGSIIDNAHGGGQIIGLDRLGRFSDKVCDSFGFLNKEFNGIDFSDNSFVIPNYTEVKNFAKTISSEIIHHRLITLDIALDENNSPVLIEYNVSGLSYWYFQLCGQITLDGFTDEIIEYCAKEKGNYTLSILNI